MRFVFDFESAVPDFALLCPMVTAITPPVVLGGTQLLGLPRSIAPKISVVPNGPKAISADNIYEGMLTFYIFKLQDKAMALWNRVEFIRRKTEELLSTAALFDALKGFAHVMVDASHAFSGEVTTKAQKLEGAAKALYDKAVETLGKDAPSYGNIEPDAQLAMEHAHTELLDAIRQGRVEGGFDAKKTLKDYMADPKIPEARKAEFVRNFDLMMVSVCEIMTRSPGHEKVADLAKRSFQNPEESIWGQVVKVMGNVAAASTQSAGQMGPGPDCLAIALLKCQLAYDVPKLAKAGVSVEEMRTTLAQLMVSGVRFKGDQEKEFQRLFEQARAAQGEHLAAQRRFAELWEKPKHPTLKEQKHFKSARAAAKKVEIDEVDKLRNFLGNVLVRESRSESTYESVHAGVALNGVLTVLSIFQVLSAWQALSEDEGWKAGKDWADLVSGAAGTGFGAIYTVNQVSLNVIKAQGWLQKLDKVMSVGKPLKFISGAIAVLGIVSGVCAIVSAAEDKDAEEIVKGALQTASSILLLIGALAFAPWATAIGALLAIGLAAYEIGKMILEASRPHCESVFRKFVEGLKKQEIEGYRGAGKVLDVLKCQSEYDQLKKAIAGMAWFPLLKDDPYNPGGGDTIRKSLLAVGFSDATIEAILQPALETPHQGPVLLAP